MCGLAGFMRRGIIDVDEASRLIRRMTDTLYHRGPDAGDIWAGDRVCLGHRRLSIIDLSEAGAQPMHSACGRFVIVFNGEVYNHRDLRADLESAAAAPDWRGHSDTETLLAGIAHWGLDETLIRAAGMFALAVWDRQEKTLKLARDRIGEKPLYWGWAEDVLVFGSELKALRQHPGFPRDACKAALAQYLTFTYVPAPRSIHPGIYKLEPGCILEVKGRPPAKPPAQPLRPGQRHETISIHRYWDLNERIEAGNHNPLCDEVEALELTKAALRAAVKRQMLADVSVGAFLSGGIDSSLIVALMQAESGNPVQTFTVGFEKADFDESPHAAAVADYLGTQHTKLMVTERDARDVIPLLPTMYDEPFADSSQIPTHLLCRAARSKVTVALSGDAGDELFGGYNRYFWGSRIWDRLNWLPFPIRRMLGGMIATVPGAAWDQLGGLRASRGETHYTGQKVHRLAGRLRHVRSKDDLYRSLVSEWSGHLLVKGIEEEVPSQLGDFLPDALSDDSAALMMAQDMRSYLPDDILCKVDRAAMSISLETRIPFLDPDVLALSGRLSLDLKIRGDQGKWILRQILYQHIPKELIERPKSGFGIPVGFWLKGPLREWAEDLLSADMLKRDGLLDPEPIRRAWKEHLSGQCDWTYRLWAVLMFMAWRSAQ